MVRFINDEVVVASRQGSLVVLNDNLEIIKTFDGKFTSNQQPRSISGNSKFIAVGDGVGTVRYYKRDGERQPQVR